MTTPISTQKIRPDLSVLGDLAGLGEMRVWSLIITIFGDAVAPRGGRVASITLQAILAKLSIKPEAMRVALHRLVKDGWIERQKTGRQSFCTLSPKGQAEFLTATRRIYANSPILTGPWQLAVLSTPNSGVAKGLCAAAFIPLTSTSFLGHSGSLKAPKDVVLLVGETLNLPDWACKALGPQTLINDYAYLLATIQKLEQTFVSDPMDATALRILMIHRWRRILLRHADLPLSFFPPNWPGETCRQLVLSQHARLSRYADPWLDQEIGTRTTTR